MDRRAIIAARLHELWSLAEQRKAEGNPPLRYLTAGLAYAPPPGDGDNSARAWLTGDEANEFHALQLALQAVAAQEARERIQRKRMARRFAQRARSPATADFDLPY